MIDHITQSLWIAVEAISHNKLRAMLTSLGIVFGVGSVISMLAVGTGAKQEILEQMKLLGATNIIITPIVEQEEGKVAEDELQKKTEKKRFSPGLTLLDAESIRRTVPDVEFISPEVVVETMVLREGLKRTSKLVGVDSTYFAATDFALERGRIFSKKNMELASPVAVIGHAIKTKFFAKEDPIGGRIKCGNLWLTVIGVLQERTISKQTIQHLGLRDYNYDIYTPVSALLLRYKNRTLVTRLDVQKASRSTGSGDDSEQKKPVNYHQLDRLVVRVSNSERMASLAEVISRMLERRHNNVVDFQVTIPEQLLRQEQRTKEIFNIVLGAIASISLIVGGIGIMNIMLASVMERTKEIGIRRAAGATRRDIALQFLSEAMMISVTGGIIGILLGVGLSFAIQKLAGIMTIVSAISVFLSFIISISIGIAFGFFPARRAAEQDPVICLRYE
ncbi:MAG: ABC transporter permease [Ignavibacteria bacterium]|nr:ABC transporter permease [Ignavibacteria bacterium]